jgi:hypothetical protein
MKLRILASRRVRTEPENFLEGGRPRPPFSSTPWRTRTSALQKILKLTADHNGDGPRCESYGKTAALIMHGF